MQYNPAFDGVRALSILAVVSFHCEAPWGDGGFVGVDMFFVLSGYLITTLLMEEHRHGGIAIGAFYARRALRLYPTLLLLIATYVVLVPILRPADDRWLAAAAAGFYVMDYALAFWHISWTIGHTWSLGVEEKFYLLWPLLLPALLRTRRPIAWLLAAFILVTAWRYASVFTWNWSQAYFSFDTRMSGILLGTIGALVRPKVSTPIAIVACTALLFCVTAPFMPSLPWRLTSEAVTLEITLAEIASFALICYLAEHGNRRFFSSRTMTYVGRLSYGIYVWHFPFVLVLRDDHAQPWWVTLPATLVFSFTAAAICLHLVDDPLKRWRKHARPLPHRPATE